MATIYPHNLGEVIDGVVKIIENPDITIPELMSVNGPTTAGIIIGTSE